MRKKKDDSGNNFAMMWIMPTSKTKLPALVAFILAALALSPAAPAALPEGSLSLMPLPERMVRNEGRLPIDGGFSVRLTGHRDSRITAAAGRMIQRLRKKTGIPFSLSLAHPANKTVTLEIYCAGVGEHIQSVSADESYALEVTGHSARLTAPEPIGILRGLETFLQLVDLDNRSFFIPCISITDRPRFPWRGLHVDVSRHWEPVDVVKRNLDAMAAVKMNVFHWHLSDDQGFRVESRMFPNLHRVGSEGNYYTQAEIRDVVTYARDRGIRVIPEFDMPGHTTAWMAAYPDLSSGQGPYQIERLWGVFDPCMDPTQKKLYSFLNAFIGEMAGLFPDEYFHIGGDEVNGKQWNDNPRIQAFKRRNKMRDNRDLQAYFNRRLVKILQKHGKKMIGWDEILHPDLPQGIVVQSWRGHNYLADSARRGYAGILSYGYYLDHMRPASFHYANDPLGMENAKLTEAEKARILGGEACMWAEFVNPENIESRIWPRAAAIAERLWSPAETRDVPDMYRRLELMDRELEFLGLRHRSHYCEMLQRMAGDGGADILKAIADLLQPTGIGPRVRARKYSSQTPLNRMVDAIPPESDAARHLSELINKALADPAGSAEMKQKIRASLEQWRDLQNKAKPVLDQSFLLEEIRPLTETITRLCAAGLQALDLLGSQQKPSEEWRTETALLLQQAEKPQAEMLIAIAPPIKSLIDAANAIP